MENKILEIIKSSESRITGRSIWYQLRLVNPDLPAGDVARCIWRLSELGSIKVNLDMSLMILNG